MPDRQVFSRKLAVPADVIDANGHVNNIAYVRWMQDIAIEHTTAVGWPMERYFTTGATWVARSHFVEYLRPAFAGDTLVVHTWITGMATRSSPRRYLFLREGEAKPVAKAETLWVCVDVATGRPVRIPDAMRAAFPVVPGDADVARMLGLPRAWA